MRFLFRQRENGMDHCHLDGSSRQRLPHKPSLPCVQNESVLLAPVAIPTESLPTPCFCSWPSNFFHPGLCLHCVVVFKIMFPRFFATPPLRLILLPLNLMISFQTNIMGQKRWYGTSKTRSKSTLPSSLQTLALGKTSCHYDSQSYMRRIPSYREKPRPPANTHGSKTPGSGSPAPEKSSDETTALAASWL